MHPMRVYDLPTRLFHWTFAALFIAAFSIAELVDDDSLRFTWHMLAGLGMLFVVMLRLMWSVVGTRHARLSDLTLAPAQLLAYMRGVVAGGGRQWSGHNPASSWAAVAMVALALGLGTTGYLMTTGADNDVFEEAHELMANAFLVVVLLHVAGVVVHVLRHRDRLQTSMISGMKPALSTAQQPVPARRLPAFAFIMLTGLFAGYVWQHYDAPARTLVLFGTPLHLGESEHEH